MHVYVCDVHMCVSRLSSGYVFCFSCFSCGVDIILCILYLSPCWYFIIIHNCFANCPHCIQNKQTQSHTHTHRHTQMHN